MSQFPYEKYSASLSREFALVCDQSGQIEWVDDRAVGLIGAEAGVPITEFVSPHSANKLSTFMAQAQYGRVDGWEITFIQRGQPIVFECSGIPHRAKILIVATQLPAQYEQTLRQMSSTMSELSTLQRETQKQQHDLQRLAIKLDEERLLFRGVASQLPTGVLVIDAGTNSVLLLNEQMEQLLGQKINPGDEFNVDIELTDPDGRPYSYEEYPIIRTLATQKEVVNEEMHVSPGVNQSRRILQVSSAPIFDFDGKMIAAVVVYHDITTLRSLQLQLEHDNLHDPLTALPNRRLLMDRLAQSLRISQRRGTQSALLFLDLDDFKRVNDTFGHAAGDELLVAIADRLSSIVRFSDTAARLAGDEFVILLDDVDGESGAIAAAERLQGVMGDPVRIGEESVNLSFSIGIALSGGGQCDAEELLQRADKAMYTAKRAGKNQYRVEPQIR